MSEKTVEKSPEEVLVARLEAAKKRSAAAEQRRELERLGKEVEAAEIAADLAEKHGAARVKHVSTQAGPVVFLRSNESVFKSFKRACEKAGKNPVSDAELERYVRPCVAYPTTAEALGEMLAEYPGVLNELSTELTELYGQKVREDSGK